MDTCGGRFREETLNVTVSSDCFQLLGDKRSNLFNQEKRRKRLGAQGEKKKGKQIYWVNVLESLGNFRPT